MRTSFWRFIHFGPQLAYSIGLGPILGKFVLLLTTVGRKSGNCAQLLWPTRRMRALILLLPLAEAKPIGYGICWQIPMREYV